MHITHPMLSVAVECPHIVQIDIGNLLFVVPGVTLLHHRLDARTVTTAGTTEDAILRHFAGLLWRNTFIDEKAFALHNPGTDLIVELVIAGLCCHAHGPVYQKQT